jgi:UDP-N-acetylmuramoyl-tripeptide--D-alanyl-D-alanine ligase
MTSTEHLYAIYQDNPIVCTDTRSIVPGSIFFALKGGNFNGNQFAEQALNSGCAYAVIDEEEYKKDGRFVLVRDVLKSLQDLARYHRDNLLIPVIGITGTNGKTTTKELINAVLSRSFKTYATKGNLNNHIGVPLTLLSITPEHEMAVIEMGANHVGEIQELCSIAKPTHGIITNIGKAHLEGFGGPQGVIKAKNELYQYVSANNGTLFVNADNALLSDLSAHVTTRSTYGTKDADVIGEYITADPFVQLRWKAALDPNPIDVKESIHTQLVGKYNFENLLAAAAIGHYFDVSETEIKAALESYVPSNNRSQVMKKGSNTILLDAYNANPTSMAAALENFAELPAKKKMLVLGDMLELGNDSAKEHQHIIDILDQKKLTNVVLVGDQFSKVNNTIGAKSFMTADEAMRWMKEQQLQDTTILIKGSRGIKLEKLVEVF